MPLDTTAAATVAATIVTHLGYVGPGAVAALPFWTAIVTDIFTGIVTHAVVAGTGPSVTAGAVPNIVVGTVT